jgi:anti-sigma regulatory factor (Ser/Thr protein kinase)
LEPGLRSLLRFSVSSDPGNERLVMKRVAGVVQELGLSAARLEQLKTAVAEAAMNAIEHGNHFQSELPVWIDVLSSDDAVVVRITDQGGGAPIPDTKAVPDLEAKLAGLQSPRGWGLFLIRNMVDDVRVMTGDRHHTVELFLSLEGGARAAETV